MRVSPDGLIRLTVDQLLSTPLTHLVSGVDMDAMVRPVATLCGTASSISGYTEWVSANDPKITIGWDWRLHTSVTGHTWVRVGLPRSNLMLTRDSGHDSSWHGNLEILGTVVDALAWREILPGAVAHRYT